MNNDKFQRLVLENQQALMEFQLYPKNPDNLIRQKNKVIEALSPKSQEMPYNKIIEEEVAE